MIFPALSWLRIAIIVAAFALGAVCSWRVTSWAYEATQTVQTKLVVQAVTKNAKTAVEQDAKANHSIAKRQSRSATIIQEVKHEAPTANGCVRSPAMRAYLNKLRTDAGLSHTP